MEDRHTLRSKVAFTNELYQYPIAEWYNPQKSTINQGEDVCRQCKISSEDERVVLALYNKVFILVCVELM